MTEARQRAWTRYWQAGALHSCPTSYSGNYEGAIADFWREASRCIPQRGRVLDLATGNGAIPQLLLTLGRSDLQIDAIDLAEVAPAWFLSVKWPQIRFHSCVSMEKLPFENAVFDLVCSQFGFEYAERVQTCHEIVRALKPGGEVRLVVHHSGSVFSKVSSRECEHMRYLLAEGGLLAVATKLAVWMEKMRKGMQVADSAVANAERIRFNAVQKELEQRIRTTEIPDVLIDTRADVQAILTKAVDPVASMAKYREVLEEGYMRCEEQLLCALDRNGIEALATQLQNHGCEALNPTELQQAEGIVGWGLACRLAD